MRYCIIDKGLGLSQIEKECLRFGGKNIKRMVTSKQIYVDLDSTGLARVKAIPSLAVKTVGKVELQQYVTFPYISPSEEVTPAFGASQSGMFTGFYQLREAFSPPIIGEKATIAILDTGIRKTHHGLKGKVIHEANFTDSPTCDDIFDHGTGVAYMAAGGTHGAGQESGLAPGALLMNIKVLNDEGRGTDESIVAGIEECYRLEREADRLGLKVTAPMDVNFANMSFGKPDTGDPDDPIRAAIRSGIEEGICKFVPVAAAGNTGPELGSIQCPACDPNVVAIGAWTFLPTGIWEKSSRGPTKEGLVKPDFSGYGCSMVTASSASDDAYAIKSGTSFASGAACGGISIVWDLMRRTRGEEFLDQWVMNAEELVEMAKPFIAKPEGIPPEKDNDYGYGTLNGFLILEKMQAMTPMAAVLQSTTGIISFAAIMSMMNILIRGLTRGLR